MNSLAEIARPHYRHIKLWLGFAAVLVTAGCGLAALSRQSLRLSQQQFEIQQREAVQQDVRVALWRLDSRLAPYVATLHDSPPGRVSAIASPDYVLERFRVAGFGDAGRKSSELTYVNLDSRRPTENLPQSSTRRDEGAHGSLDRSATVAAVAAIAQRLGVASTRPPEQLAVDRSAPEQALVQNYQVPSDSGDLNVGSELLNRNAAVQQQVAGNRIERVGLIDEDDFSGSRSEVRLIPIWVGDDLVVARVGTSESTRTLDGAWLDWPALRDSLLSDVDDLLPQAQLRPVRPEDSIDPSRTLAALPAMIVPAAVSSPAPTWTATQTVLLIAWLAFVGATLIAALALTRLIGLSERRASFVSAVTHELRTPLTTFRLYSDLLARDMVPDASDRAEYLQTLRREADRLSHLVDNVLRYSRLEQSGKRPESEPIVLSVWLDRISPRLRDRLATAEMELVISRQGDGEWMTDPAALEQVVFNLIDNAAKYAQSADDRRVHLTAVVTPSSVEISVRDHGPGVPSGLGRTMFQPFSKSARRAAETASGVGLGLALAKQTMIALGGSLTYHQADDGGARFDCSLPRTGHLDRSHAV